MGKTHWREGIEFNLLRARAKKDPIGWCWDSNTR
jgi:hypothetical protein